MSSESVHGRPTVLISPCLGFDPCRFDGRKLRGGLVDQLAPLASYLPVCPEAAIGLPEIDGAIWRARSSSCGVTDAKVCGKTETDPSWRRSAGLFAARVLARFPNAAIEDEGRLENVRRREHFLTKLFLRARFRQLKARPTRGALVRFQAENKLLLMAYHQTEMRRLGRIVADASARDIGAVVCDYEDHLGRAFARPPRDTSHVNVLMHALGYFSKDLGAREKAHFFDLLERYRAATIPLSAACAVARSWIVRFGNEYLERQSFFEPYPEALVAITDSGKGRGNI